MYTCPHCGKATFVGSGTCNHCGRAFTIASLEDLFMKDDDLEAIGKRVVDGDDGAAHVVFLLCAPGKQGKPPELTIALHEYQRAGDGWRHRNGSSMPAGVATEVAQAVIEVTA